MENIERARPRWRRPRNTLSQSGPCGLASGLHARKYALRVMDAERACAAGSSSQSSACRLVSRETETSLSPDRACNAHPSLARRAAAYAHLLRPSSGPRALGFAIRLPNGASEQPIAGAEPSTVVGDRHTSPTASAPMAPSQILVVRSSGALRKPVLVRPPGRTGDENGKKRRERPRSLPPDRLDVRSSSPLRLGGRRLATARATPSGAK